MAESQGITEALKAIDPMVWAGRMNYIRSAAMEIIGNDGGAQRLAVIFACLKCLLLPLLFGRTELKKE